jgi:hypothetical protein
MLTCAVDRISNYRTLLTGALPVQAHANRPELYEFPVELKITTGVYQSLSVGRFSLSNAAAISSGLWRDARVQERFHGQLAAPPSSRCI